MNFDWFTIISQLVNFLILVWLLYYFLFRRISSAMKERKDRISSRLNEAEEKLKNAEEKEKKLKEEEQKIDEKRDKILAEAKNKAEEKRKDLMQEARKEVEGRKNSWLNELRGQKDDIIENLRQETGRHVYSVSKKVVKDLADDYLEKQIIKVFLDKVKSAVNEDKKMKRTFEKATGKITVLSSFELSDYYKDKIRDELKGSVDFEGLSFKIDDSLICGISINVDSSRISWNVDNYINRLEEKYFSSVPVPQKNGSGSKEQEKQKEES